jgi:hypothetical protein
VCFFCRVVALLEQRDGKDLADAYSKKETPRET